jgi:hypothetical protein
MRRSGGGPEVIARVDDVVEPGSTPIPVGLMYYYL